MFHFIDIAFVNLEFKTVGLSLYASKRVLLGTDIMRNYIFSILASGEFIKMDPLDQRCD